VKVRELTRAEVATLIEDFIEGRCGPWDWDDFISTMTFDDEALRLVQSRCAGLPIEFPPANPRHYCSNEGLNVVREVAEKLKAEC
jgi:hypothetical protein